MDFPTVVDVSEGVGVEYVAGDVEDVAEDAVADRDGDPVTEVAHHRTTLQAVGLAQADAAHPALSDLERNFGHDLAPLALELDVHLDRVIDIGEVLGRELDVDNRPGDRDDPPITRRSSGGAGRCGTGCAGNTHFCSSQLAFG